MPADVQENNVPTGTEFIRALEHHRALTLAQRPGPEALTNRLLMSWIHHDNMIEGSLFRPAEIAQALEEDDETLDRYLHPLMRRIRAFANTIRFMWGQAQTGVEAVNLENLKAIHKKLTPASRDRGGLYRQTSPVHRDYYQRICSAEKVPYHLRKLFEQIRSECDDACDPVAFAAEIHLRLMYIYPFRRNPGTTARLFTNLLLVSRAYPPAVIPAHLRAEYYKALTLSDSAHLARIFRESIGVLLRHHDGSLFTPVLN